MDRETVFNPRGAENTIVIRDFSFWIPLAKSNYNCIGVNVYQSHVKRGIKREEGGNKRTDRARDGRWTDNPWGRGSSNCFFREKDMTEGRVTGYTLWFMTKRIYSRISWLGGRGGFPRRREPEIRIPERESTASVASCLLPFSRKPVEKRHVLPFSESCLQTPMNRVTVRGPMVPGIRNRPPGEF